MPPFPAPDNLLPDLFAGLPDPGSLVTEPEALRLLLRLLRSTV
jgi:hypothetical protein